MTITTTFLGLCVTALVFRSTTGRWEIDDITVMHEGHDMMAALNQQAMLEIEERVIEAAVMQDYKWM